MFFEKVRVVRMNFRAKFFFVALLHVHPGNKMSLSFRSFPGKLSKNSAIRASRRESGLVGGNRGNS